MAIILSVLMTITTLMVFNYITQTGAWQRTMENQIQRSLYGRGGLFMTEFCIRHNIIQLNELTPNMTFPTPDPHDLGNSYGLQLYIEAYDTVNPDYTDIRIYSNVYFKGVLVHTSTGRCSGRTIISFGEATYGG